MSSTNNNPATIAISSIEQLRMVNRGLGFASIAGRVPHFRFVLPGLSDMSNREASERMSNLHGECGCFAGGLLMGSFVVVFVVVFIVTGRSPVGAGWQGVGLFLALLLGSTLIGKVLGVLWARVRMVRLIRRVLARADREAA